MKLWITIAMFAGMLSLGTPLSAQDQPPSAAPASPPDQSAPSTQPQTEPAASSPAAAPASPPTETQAPAPPPLNPPSVTPNSVKKKPATKGAHKVVVRNGGAKDESAQLAPAMTEEQEQHSRESTTRLLTTTDANLKGVAGRELTPAQQGLLNQIRTYIRQSNDASKSGDLARAHTLAYKAHLLCDELMRR